MAGMIRHLKSSCAKGRVIDNIAFYFHGSAPEECKQERDNYKHYHSKGKCLCNWHTSLPTPSFSFAHHS